MKEKNLAAEMLKKLLEGNFLGFILSIIALDGAFKGATILS